MRSSILTLVSSAIDPNGHHSDMIASTETTPQMIRNICAFINANTGLS